MCWTIWPRYINTSYLIQKCISWTTQLETFNCIDVCYLPKSVGPCEGYYPTWYYDQDRKQCAQFVYGGCLGNNNKFQTREECEHLCVIPDTLGIKINNWIIKLYIY